MKKLIFGLILGLLVRIEVSANPIITVDGSSTVFPITEAISEEFQISKKNAVKVTVGIKGTGGGFKRFCRGETDVQNASRPISQSEMEVCKTAGIKYLELPVAYDAIVVAVHNDNKWLNEISIEQLKKIWSPEAQDKVTMWSQVDEKWPKEKMKLFGAGSDSGTFDFFTEAIVGKAKSSRGDYTASEDDNTIVMALSKEKQALGYLPMAYYQANQKKMKALPVVGLTKKPVVANQKTIETAEYHLARPVFIYVSEKALNKPEVVEYVNFYLKNAAQMVSEVKLVPLPKKAYEASLKHVKDKRWGTVFNGKEAIGLKIDDLLKKEAIN